MNKLIKKELEKVSVADLSHHDESNREFFIPRFKQIMLKVDSCYLIKLDKSLLVDNEMSTLSSNWNKGTLPPCEYLKVDISKVMGKMVRVNSVGYDFNNKKDLSVTWSGWLPLPSIEVLSEI